MLDAETVKQKCEKLDRVWEALSNITAELKSRGVNVSSDIFTSLRCTKALITLCESHPKLEDLMPGDIDTHDGFCVGCCGADITTRITCELRNIEDLLIIKAMDDLGSKYALELQEKTKKAWEPVEAVAVGITST